MKIQRHILAAAAAVAIGLGTVAVVAGPASAARATTCSTYSVVPLKSDHNEGAEIPRTSTSYTCTEQLGASNPGVRALQFAMNYCYGSLYGVIDEDGVFGDDTWHDLKLVQASIGVTVDGVYGPTTRSHMLWFASNLNCYPVSAYVGF